MSLLILIILIVLLFGGGGGYWGYRRGYYGGGGHSSSGLLSSFSFCSCCLAMAGEFERPERNSSLGCLTLVFFSFTPAAIRLLRKKHLLQAFEAVGPVISCRRALLNESARST